jgi:hypothetical protein
MPEDKTKEVISDKEIKVKGVDTVGEPVKPVSSTSSDLKTPKTKELLGSIPLTGSAEEQAFLETGRTQDSPWLDVGSTGQAGTMVGGALPISAEKVGALFAPLDLAKALPDPLEQEKFIAEHGEKLVSAFGKNTGISFENQLQDYHLYKQAQYPVLTKKFMDELSASQNFCVLLLFFLPSQTNTHGF